MNGCSSENRDLLKSLNAAGVRNLVVGGYAVMIHTEPRYTKDLDIWVDRFRCKCSGTGPCVCLISAPR